MDIEIEQLNEKWYQFIRFHCKEGWIDRWTGDCSNNPNNDTKNLMNLNTPAIYWRCDNQEWVSSYDLNRVELYNLYEYREEFTSKEIWKFLTKKLK